MSKPSSPKTTKFSAYGPIKIIERKQDIIHPEIVSFEFLDTPTSKLLRDEIFSDNYHVLRSHIPIGEGDVVLDLGANEGFFSIMIAKMFPGVKVYCFEPIEETFKILSRNIELNGVKDSVIPNLCSVGGSERVLDFTVCRSNSGGSSSVISTFCEGEHYKQQSKTVTLDKIMEAFHIERCKLMKIDIEGMEHEVIYSTNSLPKIDYIVGEFHSNSNIRNKGFSVSKTIKTISEKSKLIHYEYCQMAE